jgi:hypothetical protein
LPHAAFELHDVVFFIEPAPVVKQVDRGSPSRARLCDEMFGLRARASLPELFMSVRTGVELLCLDDKVQPYAGLNLQRPSEVHSGFGLLEPGRLVDCDLARRFSNHLNEKVLGDGVLTRSETGVARVV